MRVTNPQINELNENEIFVFGSNEAGIHGAGAAKLAVDKFGAVLGVGFGLKGQSFALPSKNKNIRTLPITVIDSYVHHFIEFAKVKPELTFLVTEIGCGLAGYEPKDIAPLFKNAVDVKNIHLPERFWDVLNLE